jgi:hypothetical protein
MQAFHVIIYYVPCHHPLYAMSTSTKSHIYVFNRFSVAYSMYITPQNPANDFRMIHSQQNNMLSYIMSLQTNIVM